MEGREFCTRWSRSYVPDRNYDCHERVILGGNYYRFRTPPMAGNEVEKGSRDEKYSNSLEGAEEPNKMPDFNKGNVVLVIFKNGQTKEITITHIDRMFVVGYVYYLLSAMTSWTEKGASTSWKNLGKPLEFIKSTDES